MNSPCEYTVETVSRDVARAEGWPVDADLALLQPLVDVELQRESGRCELEPAGALRIQSDLVAIRLARGTPVPELVGRVECPPMLSYAIDVALDADNGWIKGLFHAEFLAGGSELYGSAFEPAESLQGELALRVDPDRPHLARANLALWFTRSLVRGELALVVYYSDRLEPMLDTGERLTWPSYPGASCTDSAPLEPGSEWLSLDGHNAPAQP